MSIAIVVLVLNAIAFVVSIINRNGMAAIGFLNATIIQVTYMTYVLQYPSLP